MAVDGATTKHRGDGALPYREGSGDKRLRELRRTTTPTDSRIPAKHIYEFLTLGPGAISQGRGDEEPKGTEQLDFVARGRSNSRALQGWIVSIFAAETPQRRLRNARGGFSPAVSPITLRTMVLYIILQPYPPQVGQHRQPQHSRGSWPQGGS